MTPGQIEAAQRENDYLCDAAPGQSLAEWIGGMTEFDCFERVRDAMGDMALDKGSLVATVRQFAEDFENWPSPSPRFQGAATIFVWSLLKEMDSIREGEL